MVEPFLRRILSPDPLKGGDFASVFFRFELRVTKDRNSPRYYDIRYLGNWDANPCRPLHHI